MKYEMRPVRPEDLDRLFRCYCATMRQHVEPAFGWDEDFQRNCFTSKARPTNCTVIEVASDVVGFAWLDRSDEWFLRLLCIEPSGQRRGIGSAWLQFTLWEAREQGKVVRLKVFKSNPARRLYERLGFQLVAEDAHSFELQWTPDSAIATNSRI